ncbi:SNF2 family N-terminal domain-containing protein [Dactylonectria macrodidyma]|uniref:SNF2 family N-terminal domain-containing protein n=1 Tax=Dactylonectria macrodidyma TaxID=307937 RepID=A0A9P9EZB9_9HYPO|nr:SNF2 family N-terminal domain-containing protein [Dactylonectria macrodidyma]
MPQVPDKRSHPAKGEEGLTKKTKLSNGDAGEVPSDGRYQRRAKDESIVDAGPVYGHSISAPICIPSSDEDEDLPPPKSSATKTQSAAAPRPTAPNAATPGPTLSRAVTPVKSYDVCFGMLLVQATCTGNATVPPECSPVTLNFERSLLRVYLKDSSERIAVTISDALFRLVNEFAVTLTATACGRRQRAFDGREAAERAVAKIDGIKVCCLRIICYGFLQQRYDVADILAKGDLFLQHPGPAEFDRAVKYMNPQYLLPPGEDIPDIEKLSIYTCCARQGARSGESRDALGEHEQSQIFKIFNTTYQGGGAMATIEPSPRLVTNLKRHQIEALVMMVEKEAGDYEIAHFPSIWTPFKAPNGEYRYQNIVTEMFVMTRPEPIGGGILADEMGLGKTLSALSLICHSLDNWEKNPTLSQSLPTTTLIITPKSTIYGWEKQINSHIHQDKIRWITYHGSRRQEVWHNIDLYDIVLTTYDTVRSDRAKSSPLFKRDWARIVLDEAHRIRNRSSKIFEDVCKLQAKYRWCLTGTPIQNYLDDFGSLLSFIRVPPLETKDSFHTHIVEPVKQKKDTGLAMLRKVVAATCLRRTKEDHAKMLDLPLKIESVEQVEMDRNDRRLYEFFKRFSYLTAGLDKTSRKKAATNILVLISMLRLICDHGEALLPDSALTAWRNRDEKALTWEMLESTIKRCVSCDCQMEELGAAESVTEVLGCGHSLCGDCVAKLRGSASQLPCLKCRTTVSPPVENDTSLPMSQTALTSPLRPRYPPSAKVEALLRNISERQKRPGCEANPNKSVIFSFWTKMLDLIGVALGDKDMKFCRIDGQSSLSQRKQALKAFGNDPECNIMLASIGAVGEGIDLASANSVHIIEPHWNPMAEAQAVDRVHRIGQQQDVDVVRYIVNDSIESYVKWVQRHKMKMIAESLSTSEPKSENVGEVRWKKLLEHLE